MSAANKGISIIVCTYNGSARLANVITHIARQTVSSGLNWELIIVDNASTDDTIVRVQQLWEENGSRPAAFRVLQETTPGVTNARNKGILEAQYEYLIFCDDDNWLAPDFVQKAFEIFETDEKIGAVGSNGTAVADIPIPGWFDEYKDYYATGPQGERSGDITREKAFVYGAGSVFRRSALLHIRNNGFYNRMMSKTGKSLLTGEDNEYCYALIVSGYKILYDEGLEFKHHMPARRLTMKYFGSLVKAYSYSSYLLLPYQLILRNEHRPDFKFGTVWNLALIFYFMFRYDLVNLPVYLLSGKPYKIRLAWLVRLGGVQAILKNPGYQLNMYKELMNAPFMNEFIRNRHKTGIVDTQFQHT